MRALSLALVLVLALPAAAQHAGGPPPLVPAPAALAAKVKLELVTREATEPVAIVAAPGDRAGRLFVVEKRGKIRILRGRRFDPLPFLDMALRVALEKREGGEQGLLGLVFHPPDARTGKMDGRFYLNFTDPKGDTRVVEMRSDAANPDRADPRTERQLLFVDQPYANHNAGDLAFGKDGRLYIALGDGGAANDPHGHGQNPKSLLGKLIRMNVDGENRSPEVIGKGLRNPWRTSFDRMTGDLYLADVGQNLHEYVHVAPASKLVGHNFGWNVVEGFHCFGKASCKTDGLTPPVMEYSHKEGCSISGGHVYRGKAIPELHGRYFYADYCTALLRSFRLTDGRVTDSWNWKPALDPESRLAKLTAFGEDHDGELYLVSHEGSIYKMTRK